MNFIRSPVPTLGTSKPRGDVRQTPEDGAAMRRLYPLGWGAQRIAQELGCRKNTVKYYRRQGGWAPCRRPERRRVLAEVADGLAASLRQHRGNADGVRQELKRVPGLEVSALHGGTSGTAAAAPNGRPRRGPRCALRPPPPGGRCRSTLVPPESGSGARRCGCGGSWPRWGIRGATSWRRLPTSASRRGGRDGSAPLAPWAGSRRRGYWITRGRW
jgi:hypothetical protein